MPLYQYTCSTCGHVFDEFKKIDERHNTPCEKCSSFALLTIKPHKIDYWKMGTDARGNPTAGDKWAKMHAEEARRQYD